MTVAATFEGGPADGREFRVQRHPTWLRVVAKPCSFCEGTGERQDVLLDAARPPCPECKGSARRYIDVLDLLEDEPREGEAVSIYEQTFFAFVCNRGRGADSGPIATYRHVPELDDLAEYLRDREPWTRQVEELCGVALNEDGTEK